MSTSAADFLILDIGTAWTKAFLVSEGEKEIIKSTAKLPTSTEDLRFSTGVLIDKFKRVSKNPKLILTSTFNEASALSSAYKATFVSRDEASKQISEWFALQNFENPLIFDGGASNFLRSFRVADIGSFLSFRITETDLENFVGNKTYRLSTIPENKNDLEVEEAILRVALSGYQELHNPNKFNTLVVSGGLLSWAPKPTRVALLLLDLMAKGKAVQVWQDREAFLDSFGALISERKSFKQKGSNFLRNLGSLVSLGGGDKVTLDYSLSEVQEVSIQENEIALVPVAEEQKVELSLASAPKVKFRVLGGEWGIVVDGRIKPLPLEFGQERSRQSLASWQQALSKMELIEI